MTAAPETKPKEGFGEILQDVKFWLGRNNWAFWLMAIFGVVGVAIVAYVLLRQKPEAKEK
jgi:hypothetical protein